MTMAPWAFHVKVNSGIIGIHIRNESLLLEFRMPFIKMLKNKGPKIDLCGISVFISKRKY